MKPSRYEQIRADLRTEPKAWLVTGVAGFIGANLLETLLSLGQRVVGLDNFATGHAHNLDNVHGVVGEEAWSRFDFIEGDIANPEDCAAAARGVDYVLHEAALGSVPRSIKDPVATNRANVDGFLNMLVAARDAGIRRFVYAASSSTYGDHPALPKVEDRIGAPLSPYAVTKYVNELYASVFARAYGMQTVGLRYFNVFGPRQDPEGAYAAVIPRWYGRLLQGEPCTINGDGETSRDFCFVDNVVQANILAATVPEGEAVDKVYNVAFGERTTLNTLYALIRDSVLHERPDLADAIAGLEPVHGPQRPGDVRHSQADISRASGLLGYAPTYSVRAGLEETARWYAGRRTERQAPSEHV